MMRASRGALLIWAVVMQSGAWAATDLAPAKAKAPSTAEVGDHPVHATWESKLRLVKLLLEKSPAVQRIPQSNDAQAKKKLADGQALYAKAQVEFNAGRAEAAIKILDQSLRHIVSASHMVPDVAQQAAQQRRRNADLRAAILTFQTLHKSHASRMSARKMQTSAGAADSGRIDAMVEQADALITSGNQHEAYVLLNKAYQITVSMLNSMLMAETIVYDLKFDTPAEEFRHELARNRSYEELIPMALVQLNTTRETAVLAQRHVQQSRDLRDAAQKQANGGDHQTAVKSLQDATGHLQRSLRIAGVVVPQSPGNVMP